MNVQGEDYMLEKRDAFIMFILYVLFQNIKIQHTEIHLSFNY